jgi:hypothetical protein
MSNYLQAPVEAAALKEQKLACRCCAHVESVPNRRKTCAGDIRPCRRPGLMTMNRSRFDAAEDGHGGAEAATTA